MTILISIDAMGKQLWNDDKTSMPVLRNLKENGAFAEDVEVSYPSSTWISHTSIITGSTPRKHGVLGNWVIEKKTGKLIEHFSDLSLKEEVVQVPTLYDLAKKAGMSTASLCWPVTRGAENIDYCIPEFYSQDMFDSLIDSDFWAELKEEKLPVENYGAWSVDHSRGPMQDWLTNEIAKYLICEKKPDLLLIHYLLPDSFQHGYGAGSDESRWAVNYVDSLIGDLISVLKREKLFDKTNLFITADHGQTNVEKAFSPNVLFCNKGWQKKGISLGGNSPILSQETDVVCVSNGSDGFVYVFRKEDRESFIKEIKKALMDTGAIDRIIDNSEFEEHGLPMNHKDSPDFIIEAKDNYYIDFVQSADMISPSRFKGMHGFLPGEEGMKVCLLAYGPDISQARITKPIKSIDIAPTIAETMSIQFKDWEGVVLNELIK